MEMTEAQVAERMAGVDEVVRVVGRDGATFAKCWGGAGVAAFPRVVREGVAVYAEALGIPYAQAAGIMLTAQLARMAAEEQVFGHAEDVFLVHEKDGTLCDGDELYVALVNRNVRALRMALAAVPTLAAQPGNGAAQSAQGAGGRVVVGAS